MKIHENEPQFLLLLFVVVLLFKCTGYYRVTFKEPLDNFKLDKDSREWSTRSSTFLECAEIQQKTPKAKILAISSCSSS